MCSKLDDAIMEHIKTFIGGFLNDYKELSDDTQHKVCRLELYIPLPHDLIGVDNVFNFAVLCRLDTRTVAAEIRLLHDGTMVKPTKSMCGLIQDIVDGISVEYVSDWNYQFCD